MFSTFKFCYLPLLLRYWTPVSQVILGATKAVNDSVGLFSFEGDGVSLSKKSIIEYDKKGYSCYSTSRAGLFKVRMWLIQGLFKYPETEYVQAPESKLSSSLLSEQFAYLFLFFTILPQ